MARKPKTYRKLAGSGFSTMLRHSLWEGPDHLLWVESAVFQENYRRFYFQDIKSVVLRRTGRRTAWTWGLGAFLVLFAAITVFSDGVAYFSIFMTALLAILTAAQWLKGPGCRVYLQTAVQTYHLSNLVRMRKALKVMDRIRASAETAQGPLGDLNISPARLAGTAEREPEETDGARACDTATKNVASFGLRFHCILYGLLLFFGIARGAQFWLKSVPLAMADMVVLICTLVLAIVILARMRGRKKGSLLSLSAWMTLAYSAVHAMTAYGVFMAAFFRAMESMESPYDNQAIFKNFFQLQVEAQPIIEVICIGVALVSITLGVIGSIAVLNEWRNRRRSGQEQLQ